MARFSLRGRPSFPWKIDRKTGKFTHNAYPILWGPNMGLWIHKKGVVNTRREMLDVGVFEKKLPDSYRTTLRGMLKGGTGYKEHWKHPVYKKCEKWMRDALAEAREEVPQWVLDFVRECRTTTERPLLGVGKRKYRSYQFQTRNGKVLLGAPELLFLYWVGEKGIQILRDHPKMVFYLTNYLYKEERHRMHMLKHFRTLSPKKAARKCLPNRKKKPLSNNVFNHWWRLAESTWTSTEHVLQLGHHKQIPRPANYSHLELMVVLEQLKSTNITVHNFKPGISFWSIHSGKDAYKMFHQLVSWKREHNLSHEHNVQIGELVKLEKRITIDNIKTWHDPVLQVYQEVQEVVEAEKYKRPFPKFPKELPPWIEQIESGAALIEEGSKGKQNHCIGSYAKYGYPREKKDGYDLMYFFRINYGEERASLAVSDCGGRYYYREMKLKNNAWTSTELSTEVQELIDSWNS